MKIFIHNPTDFLRGELRCINHRYKPKYYREYPDETILISGNMAIDSVHFNGSEKLMITLYKSSENFQFYINKTEFTHLEVRL
jgi:hypothetical protein